MEQENYIRWPELRLMVRLSRSTIWRIERLGAFPKRRQLSANSIGWLRSEVSAWMASRPTPSGAAA
jgi:prophage regulatory protein